MTNINVAFSASDNLTQSLLNMRKNTQGLSRDMSEFRKIQQDAFGKRAVVEIDIKKAEDALKKLEKAVKKDKEGSTAAFKAKRTELDLLGEEYKKLTNIATECSNVEEKHRRNTSRNSNASATRTTLSDLKKSGLGEIATDAISNVANVTITSALGANTGSTVSNIAGGALSGAMAGATIGAIGGVPGMAIGAIIGTIAGIANSFAEKQKRTDDFFRDETKSLYTQIKEEQAQIEQRGTLYASEKEQNLIGLHTVMGNDEQADKMYQEIQDYGTNAPYQATAILNNAKQMLAYGMEQSKVMSDIAMLGDIAMGDQSKLDSLTHAYTQIQNVGVLQGDALRQLTVAGFNPLQVLAEEAGVTLEVMQNRMNEGLVSAQDVTRAFETATQVGGQFFGASAKQMDSFAGKQSMLEDIEADIASVQGEGYNETRKKGIESEIEVYEGPLGDELKEANKLIGEHKATLENEQKKALQDAYDAAMKTEEYIKAKEVEDGATLERILNAAKTKAITTFKNSEGYAQQAENDILLVADIQKAVQENGAYVRYGELMANEFSKGWRAVLYKGALPDEDVVTSYNSMEDISGLLATGLDRVPYNGMPALLHEGERVLTKVEADKQDNAANRAAPNIQITVNNNSASPYAITEEICRQIVRASENYVEAR